MDKSGSGVWRSEGVILGANMGRPIVTSGDVLLLGILIAPLRGSCLVNS